MEIWGEGKQNGGFYYLDNCIKGLKKLKQSDFGRPLNLGQDRLIRINQLADIVVGIAGTPIRENHIPGP